jgi:hypothetical protein
VEGADALGLIAEVGIAIAGFAGVISALRAPGGMMSARTALRVGALFGLSGCAVVLSILPFPLHSGGLADHTVWALSSGVMAVLVALLYVVPASFRKRLQAEEGPPGVATAMRLFFGVTIMNVVLQLANMALFHHLWPFITGLLLMTTHSLVSFAYVLLAPASSEVSA